MPTDKKMPNKTPNKKMPERKPAGNRAYGDRKTGARRNNNWKNSNWKNRGGKTSDAQRKIGSEQIEGRHAVLELLLAGTRRTREILLLEDMKPAPIIDDIKTIAEAENVPVNTISRTKFNQISHTESPQGVIAKAVPLKPVDLETLAQKGKPFLLIIDGVLDTINLGSLLRSAECAGITGVILGKHRSAQITPATAKAAAGAIEHLPIALVSSIPDTIEKLKEFKVWSVGLDGSAPQKIYDIDIANEPIALVIGSEGKGLGRLTKKRVDFLASIPLNGKLNSLNAASATAVAAFEIRRRRS